MNRFALFMSALFCLFLFCGIGIFVQPVIAKPFKDLVEQAQYHFDLEEYEQAIQVAEQVLDSSPSWKEALLLKARSLARMDQRAEAIETLDQYLAHHPDDRDALLAKGSNLARLGQHQEAIALFNQIIRHHSRDPLAWYNLATSQRETNRWQEALSSFQKAASYFHQADEEMPSEFSYLLWYQQGLIQVHYQEYQKAAELFLRAIQKRPWEEEARYQLGMVYARLRQPDESKKWMDSFNRIQKVKRSIRAQRRLVDKDPKSATSYVTISRLYSMIQDFHHAEITLIKALKQNPRHSLLLNHLGIVYIQQQNLEEARKAFEAANAEGDNLQALVNLGSLHFQQGHLLEAQSFYHQALHLKPGFAPAKQGLKQIQNAMQRNK